MVNRAPKLLLICLAVCCSLAFASDDFAPIPPDELSMKDYPASPGAAAIILERDVYTDAGAFTESHYVRIKVFTDEGKKYADVEIPFAKGWSSVDDIRARVVHSDGSVIPFVGKPFEKEVVRYRTYKVVAKTLSLPGVERGSIIEYRYTLRGYFSGHWDIQEELFTRHAHFKLKPSTNGKLAMTSSRLPAGKQPERQRDGNLVLAVDDIPAFQPEDLTLPEDELKMRVDFFYVHGAAKNTDEFWKDTQQAWLDAETRFTGKPGSLRQLADQIAPFTEPLSERLKKLYARVQQMRNLTYEPHQSEQERERQGLKGSATVEDVWKHGYGTSVELNLVFVALARAAGAEASFVRVSERDDHIFHPATLNDEQFDGTLVLVQSGTQQIYLDPGTYRCPYGLVPWAKTQTAAMLLKKDAREFVSTTAPNSSDAVTERKADLEISRDGTLKGTVEIIFHGQEALYRRVQDRNEDNAGRDKGLEMVLNCGYRKTPESHRLGLDRRSFTGRFPDRYPGLCQPCGEASDRALGIVQRHRPGIRTRQPVISDLLPVPLSGR